LPNKQTIEHKTEQPNNWTTTEQSNPFTGRGSMIDRCVGDKYLRTVLGNTFHFGA